MTERLKSTDLQAYFTKTFSTSFLLQEISLKETLGNKRPYYQLRLQDAAGTVSGTVWKECMKDEYLDMSGKVVDIKSLVAQDSNGQFCLIVREMSLRSEYDMSDYIDGLTEEESSKYLMLLRKLIDSVKDLSLKALLETVYGSTDSLEKYPCTISGHHHFSGGYLVYTYSVACMAYRMALSLSQYNVTPSVKLAYNTDLLVTGALLHAVGTVRMITPSPDACRRPESIPLSLQELTFRHVQEAICRMGDKAPDEDTLSLLFHVIGCVYESDIRKPILREALILRSATGLHDKISLLEYFISKNKDKSGVIFDNDLGNFIYVPKEVTNGENISGQ